MRKKQRSSSQQHREAPKRGSNERQQRGKRTPSQHDHRGRDDRHHPHQDSRAVISVPQNAVLAWGRHAVLAAIENPRRKIVKIYATAEMAEMVAEKSDDTKRIELEVMEKAALADAVAKHLPLDEKAVHQGLVAVMRPLDPPSLADWLDELDDNEDERAVVMLLDQITDGRNIGAMMRSARAFRAKAIITTEKHCPPESGTMLRTASGAAEYIPLIKVVNLARGIESLQDHGFMIAGMTAAGETPIRSLNTHDRLGIVMGAEGKGLRRLTEERADLLVRIPIDDEAESLNVSNAAAVALFAAQREGEE